MISRGMRVTFNACRNFLPYGRNKIVQPFKLYPKLGKILSFSKKAVDDKDYALAEAIKAGDVEKTRALIKAGAPVNPPSSVQSPLWLATYWHNAEIAQILLEAGANPNAKFKLGFSPLHYAGLFGMADLVKCLLSFNPSLNASDNHTGLTPVMMASLGLGLSKICIGGAAFDPVLLSSPDIAAKRLSISPSDLITKNKDLRSSEGAKVTIKLLIELGGAEVAKVAPENKLALVHALAAIDYDDDCSLLKALLEKDSSLVSARDSDGWTSLHWAVICGSAGAIPILFQAGIDVATKDKKGLAAFDYLLSRFKAHQLSSIVN